VCCSGSGEGCASQHRTDGVPFNEDQEVYLQVRSDANTTPMHFNLEKKKS
jgi:hypothetical protein